jgi:acyl-lipid omega-6 desaturase (Delta-12 desaturase)
MPALEPHPHAVESQVFSGNGLRPSDAAGTFVVIRCAAVTAAGLTLSLSSNLWAWLAGELLLAIALLQWFIVLHEAGHLTLFRSRAANLVAGHLAGFFALIPFASWRRVHGLHHVWTGWQDLDPTTAALVPRKLGSVERYALDWAWRLWVPAFSVLYRVSNYWNLARLKRMFGSRAARIAMCSNAALLLAAYVAIGYMAGIEVCLAIAPALVLTLVIQDPLILSQHTHIPQNVSGGRAVTPLKPAEQARHTRSLRFPRFIAEGLLLNFNAHELHHAYAGVPGYRLGRIGHHQPNEVDWLRWLIEAKRMRGSVFLFSSREETGFRW